MKEYLIKETLTPSQGKNLFKGNTVLLLEQSEWEQEKEKYGQGKAEEIDSINLSVTSAEVSHDALLGSFSIPDRSDPLSEDYHFRFLLSKNRVLFIDDSGFVFKTLQNLTKAKKWAAPSLGRFLYDFIDEFTNDDLRLAEHYEYQMELMEEDLIGEKNSYSPTQINQIRSKLRYLLIHYDQLIDMLEEFDENENGFFSEEDLHYFAKLSRRLERQRTILSSAREYTLQLRDMAREQIEIKQNRITTTLTIVTSFFLPLTLITGWYGMNFVYMPELKWIFSYPVVILVFLAIISFEIFYFKKKKWL